MNQRSSIRERLADLAETDAPLGAEDEALICEALASEQSRLVCRAATLLPASTRHNFTADLLKAYAAFLHDPIKSDPGCEAKTAVVDALRRIEFDDEDFFLQAVQYRQPEPVWNGEVDTAAELRVFAAFALVENSSRRALAVLVELLLDNEKAARAGAARALAAYGDETAKHLLRVKVHFGDPEPQVLGECCSAFLEAARSAAVPIVARYLSSESLDVRMEAAFALGNSRLPEAFGLLRDHAQRTPDREELQIALTSLALLQLESAIEFLFSLLTSGNTNLSIAAITALGHARDREAIRSRLAEQIASLPDSAVQRAFAETFPSR